MTAKWLIPTLIYVVAVGGIGVTSRLALRTLSWQDILLWTGVGYIFTAGILLALGQTQLRIVSDTPWAVLSGALAIGGLIAFSIALTTGEAGKVVPVSAAYPAVTLILAVLFLSEGLTLARVAGTALVVGGVVVITAAP